LGNEVYVNVLDKGDFVEISVEDNGIGIDKADLDMIFERFTQVDKSLSRNAEGTGIGLSIVKSFTELHGGNVRVESEFGKGSKFIVTLPARCVEKGNNLRSRALISNNDVIKMELSDII
jgi:signal transduction histidine kinase